MPDLSDKTIAIRTDASYEIGTGHVMRMLALANGLAAAGARITFICRDIPGNLNYLVMQAGYALKTLPPPSCPLSVHAPSTWLGAPVSTDIEQSFADITIPDILIADHYGINLEWCERATRKSRMLVCVDDEAQRALFCDMLINQNYFPDPATIESQSLPSFCRKLIGPKYAMLRSEFSVHHKHAHIRKNLMNVLVLMGGRDIYNIGYKIAYHFPSGGFHLSVIGGDDMTRDLCLRRKFDFKAYSHNITEDMLAADFCFGAAGSTSWERCCLALPSALFVLAENQKGIAERLEESHACVNLGDYSKFDFARIPSLLSALSSDPGRLSTMSAAAYNMTDGLGVDRIVAALRS